MMCDKNSGSKFFFLNQLPLTTVLKVPIFLKIQPRNFSYSHTLVDKFRSIRTIREK